MNSSFVFLLIRGIIFISPFTCFAQSLPVLVPAEKHTGFLSVTVTMTVTKEQYEKMLLDSFIWHEMKPFNKYYKGKKIRQMIYQKNSERVVLYFNRRDNVVIKKAEALQEGLFEPDKRVEETFPYIHEKPIDIYLDSPLYIGLDNKVTFYQVGAYDIILPNPLVTAEKDEGYKSYTITVNRPGKVVILFADSISRKIKYLCHAVVRRLPLDGPVTEPVVKLGNIQGGFTDGITLRQQNEITVNSNFSLVSGSVYFTGTGFRDVVAVDLDKGITYAKPYLDLCMPGSNLIFDNLLVSDPSGKLYAAEGFSIQVTDSSFDTNAAMDYYSITTYPQFLWGEGSLDSYVKEHIVANKNIASQGQRVSFIMKIETDGTVSPISNAEWATLSPLEKKCFEIIKNGPAWTPGTFKGNAVPMTVTFYCSF